MSGLIEQDSRRDAASYQHVVWDALEQEVHQNTVTLRSEYRTGVAILPEIRVPKPSRGTRIRT